MVPIERTTYGQCVAPTIGAFFNFMGRKHFTKEQIEKYSKDPRVKLITEKKMILTYEFRLKLWEETLPNHSGSDVRTALENNGFDIKLLCHYWICDLAANFRKKKPCGAKNEVVYNPNTISSVDKTYDEYLLSTGKFIRGRNGIKFSEDFIQEIYSIYPSISIEDYLSKSGFDINRIGYQRIYNLKKLFDGDDSSNYISKIDAETIVVLSDNPYVKRVNKNQFCLKDIFYNEARIFKNLHINEILDIFEINSLLIPISSKNRIKYILSHWCYKECGKLDDFNFLVRVEFNKYRKLKEMVESNFKVIKSNINKLKCDDKKNICMFIESLEYGKSYCYSKRELLFKIGISKTSYYSIISNDDYGITESVKESKDNKDIELIKQVVEYKNYPKGSRMVYMMLPRLTGVKMGRNKIMRLMRKANLLCYVRKSNTSRQTAKKLLEENCKPNLIKRQFKLFGPNSLFLTDVSYLKYNDQTAYLSAIKDGCTGKLIAVTGESNDMSLVNDTISLLNVDGEEKYFHSDQGILYLSPSFQQKLLESGFKQSMSRRGNCWDNASMESCFGHLKDECKINECITFEEVARVIDDYTYYYNYERPQWNRNKMTPIEYELYINNLSDEEYALFLEKETLKYKNMMENAALKAIKRAKDVGVEIK